MYEHLIIALIVLAILYYYFFVVKAAAPQAPAVAATVATTAPADTTTESFGDWSEQTAKSSIDPGILKSHQSYVANVRNYSSGASFTQVADDNTSPAFTNFLGFYRPSFVEVGSSARQVPDIDTTVLKRNTNPLTSFRYN